MRVNRKDVASIVATTFPDYRGRKFNVLAKESITIHDLNCSGGTRSQYRATILAGQPAGSLDHYNAKHPLANLAEGKTLDIPPGFAVVCHSIFCGKDTGLTIYVHPTSLTPALMD